MIPTLASPNAAARRILIASDEPFYRAGLAAVVEQMRDWCALATSAEPAALMTSLAEARASAVMIVAKDTVRTLSLLACIRDQWPSTPVILVVAEKCLGLLHQSLRMGIAGVLAPTSSTCEIRAALSAFDKGGVFLARSALELADDASTGVGDRGPPASPLSPRQREVLALVARGLSTVEIAAELGVSPRTIDSHRLAISKRLGTRSVVEFTRYALREGLVPS